MKYSSAGIEGFIRFIVHLKISGKPQALANQMNL